VRVLECIVAAGIGAPSVYFDSCMMSYEAANAGTGFAAANRA